MRQIRVTKSVIPNLFTAMNMFSGFLAIISIGKNDFQYAAWLIIIASIFDSLDGIVARLTKSSSKLGVQLDSLSDMVSFGIAPAFLIYSTYLNNFETYGILISALFFISGGFRLARFNVELVGFEKTFFYGLPIPLAAITISSLVLTFYNNNLGFYTNIEKFIIPLIILLSLLMVSKIRYKTFPKISFAALKENFIDVIFLLIAGIILIITSGKAFFYIIVFFILYGICENIYKSIIKKSEIIK